MAGKLSDLLPLLFAQFRAALYLSHRQLAAKVRAFVDCVVEAMDDEPTWESWRGAAA